MTDLIGQTIGNYRIEALLGSGGMGKVYQARHIHLNRPAALKLMHPQLSLDVMFQQRFLREARVIATLRHPHIVEIYDFVVESGYAYIVMELIDGGSLRGYIGQETSGPNYNPLQQGVELVRQTADALAYAHRQGVIHRDVKPDNLLLARNATGSPMVKIGDFGLATLTQDERMTATGATIGTPLYMSPEQCKGEAIDGRSDIYSLGLVLYEILTGQPPFQIRSASDAVYKHVFETPGSPRALRPDLPLLAEEIVLRCLAKRPEDRFASAADLATALGGLLSPIVPQIHVLDKDHRPLAIVTLTGGGLQVGRDPANDIVLDHEQIAHQQLEILWNGEQATINVLDAGARLALEQRQLQPQTRYPWSGEQLLQVGPFWLRMQMLQALTSGTLADTAPLRSGVAQPAPGDTALDLPPIGAASPELDARVTSAPLPVSSVDVTIVRPAPKPKAVQPSSAPADVAGTASSNDLAAKRIVVYLDSEELLLTPGQPATLQVNVLNLGRTVDHIAVSVEGVPAAWVQPTGTLQLNPGTQHQLQLMVHVPRGPEARAGSYEVTVLARSREDPGERGVAQCRWIVAPFVAFDLALTPKRHVAWRTGRYRVRLTNEGNAPQSLLLSATDQEELLSFELEASQLSIQPGASVLVPLNVRAPLNFRGAQRSYNLTLQARSDRRAPPQEAEAVLAQRALFPTRLLLVVLGALVIVALGLLAPANLIPSVGPPSRLQALWPWLLGGAIAAPLAIRAATFLLHSRRGDTSTTPAPQLHRNRREPRQGATRTTSRLHPTVTLIPPSDPRFVSVTTSTQSGMPSEATSAVIKPVTRTDNEVFEELVFYERYEQLWRAIAYAEGERILLTGYGRFGGTSLVNCAIEKARKELEHDHSGEGALLVFHFRLTRENTSEFEIEANNFVFGQLRAETEQGADSSFNDLQAYSRSQAHREGPSLRWLEFALPTPLRGAFLDKFAWPARAKQPAAYTLSRFIAELQAYLENPQESSAFQQIVLKLLSSDALPARVVIIIDRIKYLETLRSLARSDLFTNRQILALVVARKEDYDRWESPEQTLQAIGFSKWYVRCLWERQLDQELFDAFAAGDPAYDEQWQTFRKHLEYVARGSLGNLIYELRRSKNTSHGPGMSFINIASIGNNDDILHNAWMQRLLELNWPTILGNYFVGLRQVELEDRARIGVYQVLDWIAPREGWFADAQIDAVARSTPVTIADTAEIVRLVVRNLLQVLLKLRYLEHSDGRYRVIWTRLQPPPLSAVKLRSKKPSRSAADAQDSGAARTNLGDAQPTEDAGQAEVGGKTVHMPPASEVPFFRVSPGPEPETSPPEPAGFGQKTVRFEPLSEARREAQELYAGLNRGALRELIIAALSDEELQTFSFDFFREVHDQYSNEMSKGQRAQLLIAYCERRLCIDQLLGKLEEANPAQFNRFRSRLE